MPEAGSGGIIPSFEQGELLLTNAAGRAFRLSWGAGERGVARALPAGAYTLRTYRIVRTVDGQRWHVSASAAAIQKVQVRAGANVTVELDDAIHIRSKLNARGVQMSIVGQNDAGLTIYRSGERIPIDYRILDEERTILASGRMRYG